MLDHILVFIAVMEFKDLEYRWSAHKNKHNRRKEAECNTIQAFFFLGGHLVNHPKWRVGRKISSVNILILNQGLQ